MSKLIFITHPSVIINPQVPADQWPLSIKGVEETGHLLQKSFWPDVNAIYSSSEPKAFRVAQLIVKRFNVPLTQLDSLKEHDRSSTGYLEPEHYWKAMEQFLTFPNVSYQGWEKASDAMKRVVQATTGIMNQNSGKTIAIIGHGGTGTLLKCWIKNISPSVAEDPRQVGCYMIIDWEARQVLTDWQKY